jgi:hypothetical protein
MTQDEIIEMAMKCGASKEKAKTNADIFEAFAKLVAQRTWVGLTDEEIDYLVETEDWFNDPSEFAKVVQIKLKDKNT